MGFSDSQLYQLIFALIGGLMLFVTAYSLPARITLGVLIAALPFQPINSAYGSITTVLVYMVAATWLLRGRFKKLPLFTVVLAIILTYLISITQAPRQTYPDHVFYMISLVGNFLLFYMVYNFFRNEDVDARVAMKIFSTCGILVLIYSVLKLFIGFDQFVVFGIEEFAVRGNLEEKRRLVGPFNAVGVNGAFYGLQILLSVYFLMHTRRSTWSVVLLALILGNAAMLVATGSRGSFITTIFGLIGFVVMFARRIGLGRTLSISALSVLLFSVAAVVIVSYTEYNVLFERLSDTEFVGFVPDSRVGAFEPAFERIPDHLFTGHGPRMRLMNEEMRRIPNHVPLFFPHNLYLHLLLTVGILGFVAFGLFFFMLGLRFLSAFRGRHEDAMTEDMPRLGVIILGVFLIDELKIEFLRFLLFDFQNYMFALWAMLLAYSDRLRLSLRASVPVRVTNRNKRMPRSRLAAKT